MSLFNNSTLEGTVVEVYDKATQKLLKEYPSIAKAARVLGMSPATVGTRLYGRKDFYSEFFKKEIYLKEKK